MSLTAKQEAFCIAYLKTGNASEAYRRSYDAAGMSTPSINRKAKELLDNGKITARLAVLREPVIQKAQITLERHLADLESLRDMAKLAEKYGPAIQAEIARGKASGLYVERIGDPDGNPLQPSAPTINLTLNK
jgi:phage terminase small subunit